MGGDRYRSRSPRRSRSRSRNRGRRRSPDKGSSRYRRSLSRSRGRHGSDRDIQLDRDHSVRDHRSRDQSRDRGERRREQQGDRHHASAHNAGGRHSSGGPSQSRPVNPHNSEAPVVSDQPPPVGSIHQGSVHTVKHFGIFVSVPGYRRHVLVHHTQVSDEIKFEKSDLEGDRHKALDFLFPHGQRVWVKVTAIEPDQRGGTEVRINGSMRAVSQSDGGDLDPSGRLAAVAGPMRDEPPEEGSVHKATVKRIEAYGVFVQLDGFRKHGLVHSSQVSNYLSFTRDDTDEEKKAELAGIVAVGDVVWVKVVEVGEDDGSGRGPKVGCSIKLVEQSSGEDMDPNGLRYKPRGEGGPSAGRQAGLGAAVGQVVGGKIDWGHLAGDNRLYVGDHKGEYKLLEDDNRLNKGQQNLPPPPPVPQALPPPPGTQGINSVEEALAIIEHFNKIKQSGKKAKKKSKKKKGKDKKKSKKSKKHKKHDSSSSSSSDGSGDSSELLDS